MYLCTLNPFKSYSLQDKRDIASSNHLNQVLLNSNVFLHRQYNKISFKTLEYAQLHSTNSNQNSITSNMYLSITNIECKTYNLQMWIWTPTMLKISKVPTNVPNVHQCTSNTKHPKGSNHHNHSRSTTCMSGPITYWSTMQLEIGLHKCIHKYKCTRMIFEVRWSPPLLALLSIPIQHLWFIQWIWDISTPTYHKPYGFIPTLFIYVPSIIKILWFRVI